MGRLPLAFLDETVRCINLVTGEAALDTVAVPTVRLRRSFLHAKQHIQN
jgi:hypothetical protein